MNLSKIKKNIIISLIGVAVSFLILELFSRIFFFISDRDIKALKNTPITCQTRPPVIGIQSGGRG